MAFLSSMDISASGLTAQRFRMDVIAQNVANAQTTRTAEGGTYRRRAVVFQEREGFATHLQRARSRQEPLPGRGVRVTQVVEDPAPFQLKYDPSHPDAEADGYVRLPNVNTVTEMVDMMGAYRSYEANVTTLEAVKAMNSRALDIAR